MHVITIGTLYTFNHPRSKVEPGTVGKVVRHDTNHGDKLVSVRVPQGLIVCAASRVQPST